MRIRPARPDEFMRIAVVHETTACLAYAHIFPGLPFPREETIRRWSAFRGHVLVAEEDDELTGFVAFDHAELHALYVLPAHQGKGMGSSLLAAAGDVGILWVLKENFAARTFYEARGWHIDGRERTSYRVAEILYCR